MSAVESNFDGVVSTLVPLADMPAQHQAQAIEQSEVLHFERGQLVFNEGDSDPWSYYLLEGNLELVSGGQTVQRLTGGSAAAVHPMAQLQPRKMSARAETKVAVLRIERALLESLNAAAHADDQTAFQVAEIDSEEDDDWMTRMLQSKLFANLPASNIHRIFSLLETIETAEQDVVVEQDAPGDYYYVLVKGRAEITRAAAPGAAGYRLALIGPGDAFGEEALVGGGPRNATVRMLTAGELVRLTAQDFDELIKKPLLSAITLPEGRDIEAARGAKWLDVRFPEQHATHALEGSINHPLNTLRMHSGRLDAGVTYLVYCDDGALSAVAAFLLAERGFDVHFLQGGLDAYEETRGRQAAASDLELTDDESSEVSPATGSGPVPTSHRIDTERHEDPTATAAALGAEVQINDLRIEESAKRERELAAQAAAAAARKAAEQDAARKQVAERKRSAAEVAKAKSRAAAEARRREAAIDAARKAAAEDANRQLADERQKSQAELEALRAESRAREAATEAERRAAELAAQTQIEAREAAARDAEQRLLEERERTRKELEAARLAAEAETEQRLASEREKTEVELAAVRRQAEAEARQRIEAEARAEARERAAADAARQLEEEREKSHAELADTLRKAQRDAQLKLEAEREEAEKQIEAERARVAAELEQMRAEAAAQAEEILRSEREKASAELERARAEAERHTEEKLRTERERIEREAAQARAELDEARRHKAELERARAEAEAQAEQEREEKQRRVENMRAEMERKLKSEEAKLRESYAWQGEELKRLQAQKADAESRLAVEQQRVREQSEKARNQLMKAREFQNRLEQVQEASAAETVMREQREIELKRRLREELNQKVQTERRQLEQELARNAVELQRARREREAAEAAKTAAAEEADKVVAEFKAAHARKRMQEEAEMQVERERLETETKRLRLAFELAQRERDLALENQRRIERDITTLYEGSSTPVGRARVNLETLEAEANSAAEKVRKAELTRAQMQAAAVASAGDLAAYKVHEEHARADLKQELDDWLHEQHELETSETQQAVLANQKAHIERIKQRAAAARNAARAHDQSLIDELAQHLQNSDSFME